MVVGASTPRLHANWTAHRLHVWVDDGLSDAQEGTIGGETIRARLLEHLITAGMSATAGETTIRLPGRQAEDDGSVLVECKVSTIGVEIGHAPSALFAAEAWASANHVEVASSLRFWIAACGLVGRTMAQQRYVPMLREEPSGALRGVWMPWLADLEGAALTAELLRAMPPAARAAVDHFGHDPWAITRDFLTALLDVRCREALSRENMIEAVEGRDPAEDPHAAWLACLLGRDDACPAPPAMRSELVRGVRRWIARLEERGVSSAWRLAFELREPMDSHLLPDFGETGDDIRWNLTFFIQSVDDPSLRIEAADVWLMAQETMTVQGRALDHPQRLLLTELGRAARMYKRLEKALDETEPAGLSLRTREAYEFLREVAPILGEQGFGVIVPEWWSSPGVRLGARLRLESPPMEQVFGEGRIAPVGKPSLGLHSIVKYRWELSLGGAAISMEEFDRLAGRSVPLVRLGGRWVEVRPQDVRAAVEFLRTHAGGDMRVIEALKLAHGIEAAEAGVPIVGLDATGWVAEVINASGAGERMPMLPQPRGFHGSLRPYQLRGMAWLAFMERFGIGVCLADDMGLGKTIQILALLAAEREGLVDDPTTAQERQAGTEALSLPPTLIVVPMSVLGNWVHEAKRFAPDLRVLAHHGPDRLAGDAFVEAAERHDAVLTTYALVHRDREVLERVAWRRVVLDEAQYIKNPAAKQSQAARALAADRRVALTGTPIENRLSELWSIIDFLNPGYLGSSTSFRKKFSLPVERYRKDERRMQLRRLVQPLLLRRLKTDPTVLADLPEKVESREYCHLTSEQAMLYDAWVSRMLSDVDAATGIHRRGLVLAGLIRLKQVCNHPAQVHKTTIAPGAGRAEAERSGKCMRLLEMLDEVLEAGDQALVFTQFRQMGHLLEQIIRDATGRPVLFLHGGVPQRERDQIVRDFQSGESPVLVASLKAGGIGLNLTAATHVFHFDRWWNPAVENQATDRAYRIGQSRGVQVHKFVVSGTLEERIDEMIERKTSLAEDIIGSGERWLTELDTGQLRELLTLRREAVGDDE